jgi:hypothetical protein
MKKEKCHYFINCIKFINFFTKGSTISCIPLIHSLESVTIFVKFKVLIALSIMSTVFWIETAFSVVDE